MIADASRFRCDDELELDDALEACGQRRTAGSREMTGRAKFARTARHSRGHGKAKLFNGAHLRRRDRHVAW